MNNSIKIVNNKGFSEKQLNCLKEALIHICCRIDIATNNPSQQIPDMNSLNEIFRPINQEYLEEKEKLLKEYSSWLEDKGYLDSDWRCEGNAVEEFLNIK